MEILRPIKECQVEISLIKDDGTMSFIGDFINESEIGAHAAAWNRVYHPIELTSCFDPIRFKEVLNHCIEHLGDTDHTFTVRTAIQVCSDTILCQFEALGCVLVGYSFPKFNKESDEVAHFKLIFQPKEISKIKT